MTSGPAKLIFSLYEHPSITERIRHYNYLASSASSAVVAGIPDIHGVVDRIAAVGSVDVSKVHRVLLERWLASSAGVRQMESADVTMVGEDSMVGESGQVDSEERDDDDDLDLLRAVYLLQHPAASVESTARMLVNCVCNGDDDGLSLSQQIRALRCLFMLTDLRSLRRLADHRNWSDYFAALLYAAELRKLRVLPTGTRASFEAADKSALVRALCRSRNDVAGSVAACLAADFRLSDAQVWNAIIRRLSGSKNLDVLLRPLPCHSREIAVAVRGLVSRWLDEDAMDLATAVKICILLRHCPTDIGQDLLRRCATEFARNNLPLCSAASSLMLPRDPGLVQQLESAISLTTGSMARGVDAETAEFVRIGHILSIARLPLMNRNNPAL